MDQIGANTLNMLPNKIKICKQTHCQKRNQEIKRYPRKKHMYHFQCQQTEFKCKKVPNISDWNKQLIGYFTLVHAHTMTVKTVSFIDAYIYCMIIQQ